MREELLPCAGRLVVEPLVADKIGSLLLPDGFKRPVAGRVLSIGPRVHETLFPAAMGTVALTPGCEVVHEFAAGNTFDLDNGDGSKRKVVVLKTDDVLAVVVKK